MVQMVHSTDVGASPKRRKPLGDASLRANINTVVLRKTKSLLSSASQASSLPHHEYGTVNSGITARNAADPSHYKRISAATAENHDESKRDSQTSTTSTNTSSKGRRRKTHIGPWQLGPDIGKGGCGKVRKVKHCFTGQIAAAKIISKKVAEKARAESLMSLVESSKKNPGLHATTNIIPFGIEREIAIMKLLEHPNVVKLYDLWENRDEIYLIMEYVDGGELFEYVDKYQYLEDDESVYLFRQIVAALLHCHRLGIHHRDLKPENILLDKATMQVKLVDFGMAALQPPGKLLTTPCGSVHYAAPEVFEKTYDGNKVDVWSLGVLLYVMLTGTIPFDYKAEYVSNVLPYVRLLKSGRFFMPENLSTEAKDLIKRMLVPEPTLRISLDEVWKHPFIHKYEAKWKEPQGSGELDRWIGPAPVISSWTIKTKNDIDREIFRNLKTLWHSEKESVLIEKLLSAHPNQEKFFYFALQKYQEDQLENYAGSIDGIPASSSDHHHISAIPQHNAVQLPPIPSSAYERTKSSYSILDEERNGSRVNLRGQPPSVDSYDPYRASKKPVVPANGTYSVTVHRNNSKQSRGQQGSQLDPHKAKPSKRHRNRQSNVSTISTSHLSAVSSSSRISAHRPISSQSTEVRGLQDSPFSGSSRVKANMLHKRRVKFSHLRRSSTVSALSRDYSFMATSPLSRSKSNVKINLQRPKESPNQEEESVKQVITPIPSPQEKLTTPPEMTASSFDNEARQVSTELEKFCEDAFYNLPDTRRENCAGNSQTLSQRVIGPRAATPKRATGISKTENSTSPCETPNTYVNRELAQTRQRIAARFAQDESTSQNSAYRDILAQLDSLLAPDQGNGSKNSNRASSAPAWHSEVSYDLPIIKEEKSLDSDFEPYARIGHRCVTAPTSHSEIVARRKSTIKVVGPDSPRVMPLVIRKTSEQINEMADYEHQTQAAKQRYYSGMAPRSIAPNVDSLTGSTTLNAAGTTLVDQYKPSVPSDTITKKKGWFHRRFSPREYASKDNSIPAPPLPFENHQKHYQKHRENFSERFSNHTSETATTASATNNDFNALNRYLQERSKFLRFWRKKKGLKQKQARLSSGDEDSVQHVGSAPSRVQVVRSVDHEQEAPKFGVQRSWLARIFHIKPISSLLCFHVGRGKARQEVVRLLKSWRMYGMRDVVLNREHNLVYGTLASTNSLGIKEVSFVAELFVILEHGRRAQLSMARFTQRSGAASSFKRVVETLEEVLAGRGLLVSNEKRKKEMEAILNESL